MLQTHTVTFAAVTTTKDALGNTTETDATTVVSGLLFAPEGLQEQTDPDRPRVIGDATLYGTLTARLGAGDTVTHAVACCDGSDFAHGYWEVVGGSKGWGGGDHAIPIRRTGAS